MNGRLIFNKKEIINFLLVNTKKKKKEEKHRRIFKVLLFSWQF